MDITRIENNIHEYIDKLLTDIIDESIIRKIKNPNDFLNVFKILLCQDDNSLLKKQIQFVNTRMINHVVQDGNKFSINFEDAYQEFVFSSFSQTSSLFEKNITEINLSKESISSTEKLNLNQEEAAELLTKNIDFATAVLINELKKNNIEEMLYTLYSIAGILSLVSSVTAVKIKCGIDKELYPDNDRNDVVSLLLQTVENLDIEEIKKVSYIIGEHKYACDMLFNIIYKLYLVDKNINDKLYELSNISWLFAKTMVLNRMELFRQSNALLYERGDSLSVDNYLIYQSGNLSDRLNKLFDEVIRFNYNQNLINGVFDKYKKHEGFSPDNLSELNRCLLEEFKLSDRQAVTKINIYPIEAFKNYIKESCNIAEKGVDTFFSALCLDVKADLFDISNKISRTPLVLTKDNKVLTMVPLLLQAEQMLRVRMLDQNFTNNPRVKKYISKHYNEDLIDQLTDTLRHKDITVWDRIHLAAVSNKKIRTLFVSGITEEIDIAYIKDNILYFVEYKAWMSGSSNIKAFLGEYKKAENNVKSHYKAIEIVKNNINVYAEIFGQEINNIQDIRLLMVFQNPNAFNYLNKDKNVKGFSFEDFVKSVNNI